MFLEWILPSEHWWVMMQLVCIWRILVQLVWDLVESWQSQTL